MSKLPLRQNINLIHIPRYDFWGIRTGFIGLIFASYFYRILNTSSINARNFVSIILDYIF